MTSASKVQFSSKIGPKKSFHKSLLMKRKIAGPHFCYLRVPSSKNVYLSDGLSQQRLAEGVAQLRLGVRVVPGVQVS